ncbi:long-chain-fatty-acid--CoA ligase [Streptomyces mobaraensis NBRC 13819 = DSM 40847]|uniref:Long-chain-fatty-acid--CoA ligase n=1 Tax=Streptomyces mobaraensis (strain ATCC 29032 / DSM 40847 / JCM 4168 / NBRC 13819 / NCIMB 11159 / IPCR 16-22) TaxID=1223523 RepID=M3A741_STRM1|nr:long-chain-fatty-acid--CoA ligase [Streptomyces mobaraensis]EMF00959.1 long-chain-fatty-acid--CoA ligase [Streptomyces mobaraensis NBRC 13819 = DSM 40847]QTT72368.1 long-chain-fatty-acid--CoA ligase [Streptomyces mobaraensis NBRC 13819 = DSM 40847]
MPTPLAQRPRLLHELPDRGAARAPDAEALVCGGARLTWSDLRSRADLLRGALRTAGVDRGGRVAVVGRNGLACLETVLAAAGAGAATAILNWRLAPPELAHVIADSGATVLFADAAVLDAVRTALGTLDAPPRLVVTGDGAGPADGAETYAALLDPAEPLAARDDLDPDDTCVILYTSGTTGSPKGAELTHRGLLEQSAALLAVLSMGPADRSVAVLPFFHVGGVCYVVTALLAGAPTVVLREATPEAMCAAVADGATHLLLVPAMLPGILAAGPDAVAAFGRLRYCLYGASPMPLPVLRRALALFPGIRFLQLYGMTELSGAATALAPEAHRDPAHAHRLASAGRPMPGVEARVVDPATRAELPPGRRGELWIRSPGRMKGYLGNPAATAETVTDDGWLRTGDLARIDEDGYVFVEDRLKDLIITGGENVCPAEVERVLVEHPAVVEAAVIGVPDEKWGETVRAVLVTADGVPVDPAELRAFCRERLAGFKCPTSVGTVAALPRNATGKIDKNALRAAASAG